VVPELNPPLVTCGGVHSPVFLYACLQFSNALRGYGAVGRFLYPTGLRCWLVHDNVGGALLTVRGVILLSILFSCLKQMTCTLLSVLSPASIRASNAVNYKPALHSAIMLLRNYTSRFACMPYGVKVFSCSLAGRVARRLRRRR
jgi:hypothetical protein